MLTTSARELFQIRIIFGEQKIFTRNVNASNLPTHLDLRVARPVNTENQQEHKPVRLGAKICVEFTSVALNNKSDKGGKEVEVKCSHKRCEFPRDEFLVLR